MKKYDFFNNLLGIFNKIDFEFVTILIGVSGIALAAKVWAGKNELYFVLSEIFFCMLLFFVLKVGSEQDEKEIDRIILKYREGQEKIVGHYAGIGERIKEQVNLINSLKGKKDLEIDMFLLAIVFRNTYYYAEDIVDGYALPTVKQLIDISKFLFKQSCSVGLKTNMTELQGRMSYAIYLITGNLAYLADDYVPEVDEIKAMIEAFEKESNAEYFKLLEEYACVGNIGKTITVSN